MPTTIHATRQIAIRIGVLLSTLATQRTTRPWTSRAFHAVVDRERAIRANATAIVNATVAMI